MDNNNYRKQINKVSIVTIIGNFLLTVAKVVGGILAKSSSLISDAVHSGSDVVSTIIVMIGAKLSSKEPDENHPFGHERFESIACIILAMLLAGTGVLLCYSGILNIIEFANGNIPQIDNFIYLALGFAIGSIVIKFVMFIYTFLYAKKINSPSLKADSVHHLSDSLSSIGSVLGIVGLLIGGKWAILDPIATIIIALFIFKVAFDICKQAINEVVDKKGPKELEDQIKLITNSTDGVKEINSLKTRVFGNKYYVEIEIAVDSSLTVTQGHNIALSVHDKIENTIENIKHCVVHIDPYEEKKN